MKGLKFWNTEEFDIASFKWKLSERINEELLGNGSDKGNCYYTFNELGFRGDSPKKKNLKFRNIFRIFNKHKI